MIDYIRLHWRNKFRIEKHVIKEGNFEELFQIYESHSGEIRYPYTTSFYGMSIVLTEKYGYVKNSIHKSYNIRHNEESHNYNDFTYANLCEQIDYIINRLTDIESSGITQLEFGLNIPIGVNAEDIIEKNILMHKFKSANHNKEYYGTGKLKQFDHYNYVFKIYDKAKQYGLITNIIRIEIKFMKAKEFQAIGVFNLVDLKNRTILCQLFFLLLKRFDELIIIDDFIHIEMVNEDLRLLRKYSNTRFWEIELKDKHPNTRSRHKDKFLSLLKKYDLLKIKTLLREQLIRKFINLINATSDEFPGLYIGNTSHNT